MDAIALSVFAPSGVTIDQDNNEIAEIFYNESLYAAADTRLGDVVKTSLEDFNMMHTEGRTSYMSYNLLGDPAMQLPVRSAEEAPARDFGEGQAGRGSDWLEMIISNGCAQSDPSSLFAMLAGLFLLRRRRR